MYWTTFIRFKPKKIVFGFSWLFKRTFQVHKSLLFFLKMIKCQSDFCFSKFWILKFLLKEEKMQIAHAFMQLQSIFDSVCSTGSVRMFFVAQYWISWLFFRRNYLHFDLIFTIQFVKYFLLCFFVYLYFESFIFCSFSFSSICCLRFRSSF